MLCSSTAKLRSGFIKKESKLQQGLFRQKDIRNRNQVLLTGPKAVPKWRRWIAVVFVFMLGFAYMAIVVSTAENVKSGVEPEISALPLHPVVLEVSLITDSKDWDAVEQRDELLSFVFDAIDEFGYISDELVVSEYQVNPHYEGESGDKNLTGYTLSSTVEVPVADVRLIGSVMNNLIVAGKDSVFDIEIAIVYQ